MFHKTDTTLMGICDPPTRFERGFNWGDFLLQRKVNPEAFVQPGDVVWSFANEKLWFEGVKHPVKYDLGTLKVGEFCMAQETKYPTDPEEFKVGSTFLVVGDDVNARYSLPAGGYSVFLALLHEEDVVIEVRSSVKVWKYIPTEEEKLRAVPFLG